VYVAEACLVATWVATLAWGLASISRSHAMGVVAPFIIALAFETVALVWAPIAYGVVSAILETNEACNEISGRLTRTETLLDNAAASLKTMADVAPLSDKAKSTLYREREIEALGEMIQHHLMLQDYDAASTLITLMDRDFGHHEQARRLRQEVAASRKATMDEKVETSIGHFQEILDLHDWVRANREAQRMMNLMPNNNRVAQLLAMIKAAQLAHKRQLLQSYGEAIRKNDVDRSIELLHQLDPYLTPQEAAALQESARDVFRAKLQNLGFQFTMCVTDQRWAEAVATGEEIIHNYPNSRMAQEVREKMELLKSRASIIFPAPPA
jgi:hypothetical protein